MTRSTNIKPGFVWVLTGHNILTPKGFMGYWEGERVSNPGGINHLVIEYISDGETKEVIVPRDKVYDPTDVDLKYFQFDFETIKKNRESKLATTFSILIKIIEGGMKGDITKVRDYALLLSDNLESDGEIERAHLIRKLAFEETGGVPRQEPEIGTITADGHLIGEE